MRRSGDASVLKQPGDAFAKRERSKRVVVGWAAIGAVLSLCLLMDRGTLFASAATEIHSSSASLTPSQVAVTNIFVSPLATSAQDVNAFDLSLSFDARIANASGLQLGPEWSSIASLTAIDNNAGLLRVVALRTASSQGTVSPCPDACLLFSVSWLGKVPGTSVIALAASEGNPSAAPGRVLAHEAVFIDAAWFDGLLTVLGAEVNPTPTISVSSTPTQGGTAPAGTNVPSVTVVPSPTGPTSIQSATPTALTTPPVPSKSAVWLPLVSRD